MERAITRESYEQFCNQVQQTIEAVPVETINRIIKSMNGCQVYETSKRFRLKLCQTLL